MKQLLALSHTDVEHLLLEDLLYGDLTTRSLDIGSRPGRMSFAARDPLILCGIEEAAAVLELAGATVRLEAASGDPVTPGCVLLTATGRADALLAGWKVAQTLVEWASGISSATAAILAAARQEAPEVVVACTRKTVPLTRRLSVKAVLAGGGTLHRTGLSDTILIFPEHRAFLTEESLPASIARLRKTTPERAVVVEVKTVAEAIAALDSGADVLQLEKFSPGETGTVVAARRANRETGRKQPVLALAGGINAGNAARFAATGAEILVTSAPYTAPPRDVQVTIEPA